MRRRRPYSRPVGPWDDMTDKPPALKTETDPRVTLWFFSWLAVMFLCSGGFALMTFASPEVMRFVEQSPWVILVCVAAGFTCVGLAIAPWYFGIRCRRCRRRLRRMAAGCDLETGITPSDFTVRPARSFGKLIWSPAPVTQTPRRPKRSAKLAAAQPEVPLG